MEQKINTHILDRPLYPYFYGAAFLVFKSSAFLASFQLLPAVLVFLLFIVLTNRMIAVFARSELAVVLFWASLFHVTGIAQACGLYYAYVPFGFYVIFYLLVVSLLVVYFLFLRKIRFLHVPVFNRVANTFLLMACIVFLVNGLNRLNYTRHENNKHHHDPAKFERRSDQPDIVWILMDEYASPESLGQQFGFTNPLDSFLEHKGFMVARQMHTRFPNTLFSVNALFNKDDSIAPSSYYEGIYLLRHGSLVPAMETLGYRFVNLGFFDIGGHPMLADRSGYPYNYLQQLLSGTLFHVFYQEWKNSIPKCDRYVQDVFHRLDDSLAASPGQPRFIWAHLPIPHGPFCRNKEGSVQQDTTSGAFDSTYLKRKYVDYLQYGNSLLMSLLAQHPDFDKKIILITGDHGPRYPFLPNKSYQNQPYTAIHIPGDYNRTAFQKLYYISQIPGFLLEHLAKEKRQ